LTQALSIWLKLALNLKFSCLLSVGITGMYHHA
jgi:hypothetical protein